MESGGEPRVAVVTGAGSGIGREAAVALAGDGFSLVLAGRRADPLEETLAAADSSSEGLCVATDVSDHGQVTRLFDRVRERFGRVDVLFNNAGSFGKPAPIEEVEADAWRQIVDVNLNGAFFVAQAAFRLMAEQRPQGGRIINNGSISAQVPRPASVGYSATKHAINGLTKSLALDGRRYDIAAGQIDIGNAATPLAANFEKGTLQADGSMKPEPTMAVSDVARAVAYMASLPLDANVLSLTVMATKMPLVGRG